MNARRWQSPQDETTSEILFRDASRDTIDSVHILVEDTKVLVVFRGKDEDVTPQAGKYFHVELEGEQMRCSLVRRVKLVAEVRFCMIYHLQ